MSNLTTDGLPIHVLPADEGYGVSSDGRVWTRKNNRHGLLQSWRELVATAGRNGYLTVKIGRGNTVYVHHLVAAAFVLHPEGCSVVNHLDSDKTNNRHTNLEWTTPQGNAEHASRAGTLCRGQDVHCSVLTEEMVRGLRAMKAEGKRFIEIVAATGLPKTTVWHVLNRVTWAWLL